MKISLGKKVAIGLMIFIYGMGVIAINLLDQKQVTRNELTRFYETEMDSCAIERIDTLDVTNRGGYQIFYTDCSSDFYPIFLQDNNEKEFIKIKSLIIKEANSPDITIVDNEKHYNLKLRHPDTQDDRGFGTLVLLGFIGVATILILLAPNSKFQKMEDM